MNDRLRWCVQWHDTLCVCQPNKVTHALAFDSRRSYLLTRRLPTQELHSAGDVSPVNHTGDRQEYPAYLAIARDSLFVTRARAHRITITPNPGRVTVSMLRTSLISQKGA